MAQPPHDDDIILNYIQSITDGNTVRLLYKPSRNRATLTITTEIELLSQDARTRAENLDSHLDQRAIVLEDTREKFREAMRQRGIDLDRPRE